MGNQQRDEVLRTIRSLHESPGSKEAAILQEQKIALDDVQVREFVDTFYFDADRDASLRRYLASGFPDDVIDAIRRFFGDQRDIAICEIGGGNGFLSAALLRAGYTNVDMVEPATQHVTGTGYLKSLPEFSTIKAYSDLDEWYASPQLYNLIITNACIHHFNNPVVDASQIRLKVRDRSVWLAFTEFFSADYEDTFSQLNHHRHAILYGLYEWPYSPGLYAAMLGAAGFSRIEIAPTIPHGRRPLSPVMRAYRLAWRIACRSGLSGAAYGTFSWLISRFSRSHVRLTDASYMAFRARPVRWKLVQGGYTENG